jgi:hypothetical protein
MAQRILWVVALCLMGPAAYAAPQFEQGDRTELSNLSMEVNALQTLRVLKLTPEQMHFLRELAPETAQKERTQKTVTASREYRNVLAELHAALIADIDDDRIDELTDKLMELRDAEDPELNDAVETTDAARKRTSGVFGKLTPRQIATYLGAYGEDFPDPVETVRNSLKELRALAGGDYTELRDEVADQVAVLVAGFDEAKASPIRERVTGWLDHVHGLGDAEFKAQRAELDRAAEKTVGSVNAMQVLRNVVERDLAELLSNPRLVRVLEIRLKNESKEQDD